MERDAGDILDRWSIAKLKKERIATPDNKKEFDTFFDALINLKKKYPKYDWEQFSNIMLSLNDFIWQFEAGLKSGKEQLKNSYYVLDEKNKEILSKIGIIAVIIRNFNSIRVQFKNIVNKLVGEGFQDIKKNHISGERIK